MKLSNRISSYLFTAKARSGSGVTRTLAVSALLLLFPVLGSTQAVDSAANAKSQSPIVVSLKQFKVVKEANGDAKFVDGSIVVPGDVLEYRATYTNRGAVPLSVVASLPVPESVEYVKGSAKAKGNIAHTVAQKDAQFAAEPLMKPTLTASGATVMQAVPYSTYRFVRWNLGSMAPGTSTEVSIRTKVSDAQEEEPAK
jgi:uncharacterized repeat protein (TIGR01451 family)